ncbi:MAG: AEC family transporter [Lachnospiraceae bacterium]|nr:AEC family transporter [Lachnospiraceae bacterium]
MSTSVALMSKLASMLLMVILGIIIVRVGLVKETDAKPLSAIVVYVLQPALIIHAMELELTPERIKRFAFGVVFCICVYILWIFITEVLKKPCKLLPADIGTLIYSNAGNLTLPVVAMVLGEEMVFYVSALQIPFNIFIWTHGNMTMSGEKSFNIKKILLNSNIIALVIGLLLTAFNIRLPEIIDTTISTLNNAVAAISMLVIGMVMGKGSKMPVSTIKRAHILNAGRLIIFPMIAMVALYATGVIRRHPEYAPVAMALFVGLSAPPASTISQLAVLYDEQPYEASAYNTIGMFLCIITMPLILLVYQMMFM